MKPNTVLMILDTQVNMFDDKFHVYDGERILEVICSLAATARSAGVEIIYLRNNREFGEPDEPGSLGWEIHSKVAPQESDVIFDKSTPDAFAGTGLQKALDAKNVKKIIVTGMQTEMCVAATCRKADELGYEMVLVEDGHTTFDWEEIKAIDAIAKCNAELFELMEIRPADQIEFI